MQREWLVIVALVAAALVPMWFVAAHGESPTQEVGIDQSVTEMQPLEGFLDTPNKLSPSQVGVIVWVALLALMGVLSAVHRFMNEAVRPDEGAVSTDGGTTSGSTADGGKNGGGTVDGATDRGTSGAAGTTGAPWFTTAKRSVVEYHGASEELRGIVAMGGLTIVAIVFAALFTGEYLTLARTQYFGVYAAGMFLSLALLTVAYYAWFLPHVAVAEERGL
ncbi:MAG: hypothetical protein ABEJ40_07460 [Haloarculaceae archaeon]